MIHPEERKEEDSNERLITETDDGTLTDNRGNAAHSTHSIILPSQSQGYNTNTDNEHAR